MFVWLDIDNEQFQLAHQSQLVPALRDVIIAAAKWGHVQFIVLPVPYAHSLLPMFESFMQEFNKISVDFHNLVRISIGMLLQLFLLTMLECCFSSGLTTLYESTAPALPIPSAPTSTSPTGPPSIKLAAFPADRSVRLCASFVSSRRPSFRRASTCPTPSSRSPDLHQSSQVSIVFVSCLRTIDPKQPLSVLASKQENSIYRRALLSNSEGS